MFVKVLKVFYDATFTFFGSLHVTIQLFLTKLCEIQKALDKWRKSDDPILQKMTTNMQIKFSKYWKSSEINVLLFVAVFLDPRFKLQYVEFCFGRLYGNERGQEMIKKLKDIIEKLFEYYANLYPLPVDGGDFSSISSSFAYDPSCHYNDDDDDEKDWVHEFRIKIRKKQSQVKRNEMDRYMEDDVEDSDSTIEFDILKWWKLKSTKYYILSHMAKDILAIPVSTVSSESAFSTGGRDLDSFRSSLNATTV
ncbi:hypothetical protein Fmac_011221 [Flemingia macrophylla]|uniref:Uncharacterized protein n=1 Tax=Flemingia macrophylla TaxID=520843 RepID=A0ABD1MLV0_9FABA